MAQLCSACHQELRFSVRADVQTNVRASCSCGVWVDSISNPGELAFGDAHTASPSLRFIINTDGMKG